MTMCHQIIAISNTIILLNTQQVSAKKIPVQFGEEISVLGGAEVRREN